MDIIQILAQELDKNPQHVENVVRLLDEGNTIPFIARYRKELHGAMDDTALRTLEERLQYLRNLADRREAVKKAIEEQGKLTAELSAAMAGDGDVTEELGDLLFAVVNAARFLKVDPEDALHAASDKFSARFRRVEEAAAAQGRRMENMTLAEMDRLWDEVKHKA